MPTIFSHALVGLAGASVIGSKEDALKVAVLSVLCALAPDADVIAFKLGIAYGDFFGHRGFFHSLFAGACLGFLVTAVFFRSLKVFSREWWTLSLFFSVITCSHGILDAFTNGGLGIALLSPFDDTRYFFWITPIEVVALNPSRFFSAHGQKVMLNEMALVWLPIMTLALSVWLWRRKRYRVARENVQDLPEM